MSKYGCRGCRDGAITAVVSMFGLVEEINARAEALFSGPIGVCYVFVSHRVFKSYLCNVTHNLMHEIVFFPAIKMINPSLCLSLSPPPSDSLCSPCRAVAVQVC